MKFTFRIIYIIISLSSLFLFDRHQIDDWAREKELEVAGSADLIQLRLQNVVSSRINSTEYMKALFEIHPDTSAEEFSVFAEQLIKINPYVRALQFADAETRVKYVYPLQGNEVTVDEPMLLIEDPERGEYVRKAIDERRLTLQPPFKLRQGGLGIVARNPVFIDGRFSGLTIAVLDLTELLDMAFNSTGISKHTISLETSDGLIFYGALPESDLYTEERIIRIFDVTINMKLYHPESFYKMPLFQRFSMSIILATVLLSVFIIIWRLLTRMGVLEKEVQSTEARSLSIIENTGAGFFQIDKSGVLRDVNQAWLDLHGYNSRDEVVGMDYSLTQAAFDTFSSDGAVEALLRGEDVPSGEFSMLKKDGTSGYYTFTARPYYEDGEIGGLEGFIFDISDRIEAEKQKDLLMKELNHRVKNNLMIISSLLELKDATLGDGVDLSDISGQINAIQLIYEKLHTTGEVSTVVISDYLKDLADTIFSSFTDDEVEIRAGLPNARFNIKTAVTIGLIVNEIATNAVKYGFKGGGHNWFRMELVLDKPDDNYVLSLANSGDPIADGVDFNHPGTFGMRLVHALVKQLYGSIDLQNNPETVFTIIFPANKS